MKLGRGELEHVLEDGLTLSVQDARDYFQMAIQEVAPEVSEDLAGEPFRLYAAAGLALDLESFKKSIQHLEFYDQIRAVAFAQTKHNLDRRNWTEHFEDHNIDYDPKRAKMQESILKWSRKHNLDVAWFRAMAFETLDTWYQHPPLRAARVWLQNVLSQTISPNLDAQFRFSIRSHYPAVGFRKEEQQRIGIRFEEELDAFLDKREALAKEGGMVRPSKKREFQSLFGSQIIR